jgi:hypothetical membrane protein
VFAHAVTDNLSLVSDALSLYALEEHGFVLELGFYSIGLSQLLIAFLLLGYIQTKHLLACSLFLSLAGFGVIAVALFPTLPPPASINDRLPHIIGAIMQFFFFPLAALALSRNMNNGTFKTYTQVTGLITALLFVTMLVLFVLPSMKDFAYFGLIEKVDILTINLWLILTAFTLRKYNLGLK